VISLRGEELIELLVLENSIEDPDFINSGLSTSISDSGSCHECKECEMDFPDECLVEHKEAETCVTNKSSGPAIVRSVESLIDLINVVGSSHSPFPEVVVEEIVGIVELAGVSFGF
jgi:hypothetical protein